MGTEPSMTPITLISAAITDHAGRKPSIDR